MKQFKKVLYLVGVTLGSVGLIFIGTFVVMVAMMAVGKFGFAIEEDMLYHVSGGLGTLIAAWVCVFYVRRKKYCQCVEPTEKLQIGKAFFVMLISVCVCQILWSGFTTPMLAWLLPQKEQVITISASTDYVHIAFAVLVAPIAEELLFRMGIFCMFRRKVGKVGSAMVCAVVFALLHGYQLEGFLSCLVAGLVYTFIYDKTGNIVYSILAHMACNISVTVTNALERTKVTWLGFPVQYEINGYNMYHIGLIILAAVFCGGSLVVLYKKKHAGMVVRTN